MLFLFIILQILDLIVGFNQVSPQLTMFRKDTKLFQSVNKRNKNYVKIFDDIDFKRIPEDIQKFPPIQEDPFFPYVKSIVLAASSRKATDIMAFRISHISEIASFMVIIEGNSRPQNQAIANSIKVCRRI